MSARLLTAPMLLLLWQVAPMNLHRDGPGRIRIGVGGGGGDLVFRDAMTCAGESVYEPVHYTSWGGTAEVWASDRLRIHAAAGDVDDGTVERSGVFGAAQAVLEEKRFGVGIGVTSFGGIDRSWSPSASLRLGPLDRVHLRADYGFPEPTMGLTGLPRVGVGLNQGRDRSIRVFAGATTTPIPESEERIGAFLDLAIPLGNFAWNPGLAVHAFFAGTSRSRAIYTVGAGVFIQP